MAEDAHRHTTASYPQGKELRSHCSGYRLGLRAGLDGHGESKSVSSHGVRTRTVLAVASRYTHYTIPTPQLLGSLSYVEMRA